VKIAIALFTYFPYGGLQKDMWRIAHAIFDRGHEVEIFCAEWRDGDKPAQIPVTVLGKTGWSNHTRNRRFANALAEALAKKSFDCIVGFDKLPNIDWYYAADSCFKTKVDKRSKLYKYSARAKQFLAYEESIFCTASHTQSLMISAVEMQAYQQCYQTPSQRLHLLPPGISPDRVAPDDAEARIQATRKKLALAAGEKLLLMVGSGFRTKGVDRAIQALAALPKAQQQQIKLKIAGQDNPRRFLSIAKKLGVSSQVEFLGGRDDVPDLLLTADLLIHPAYRENTGTVLLEAMVAGTPVLVTDVCGYAHYISDYNMGKVVSSPFDPDDLQHSLSTLLFNTTVDWHQRGKHFATTADIYSMPEKAATLIIQSNT